MTRTVLLLGFCSLGMAQAPADWRFAHPDADMKMSINVKAVIKTDAFGKGMAQAQSRQVSGADCTGPRTMALQMAMVNMLVNSVDRVGILGSQED